MVALLGISTLVRFGKANGLGAAITTLPSDIAALTRTAVTYGDTLDTDDTILSSIVHLFSGGSVTGLGYLAQKAKN